MPAAPALALRSSRGARAAGDIPIQTASSPNQACLLVYVALESPANALAHHNLDFFLTFGAGKPEGVAALPQALFVLPSGLAEAVAPRVSGFGASFSPLVVVPSTRKLTTVLDGLQLAIESLGGIAVTQAAYATIVVVTDETRGPFVPVYLRHSNVSWSDAFTGPLSSRVGGVHLVTNSAVRSDAPPASASATVVIDDAAFGVDTTYGLPALLALADDVGGDGGQGDARRDVPARIAAAVVTGAGRGRVALANYPMGSPELVGPRADSGFEALFVRAPTRRSMLESQLALSVHDWRTLGRAGAPFKCTHCPLVPPKWRTPESWREVLAQVATPPVTTPELEAPERPDGLSWLDPSLTSVPTPADVHAAAPPFDTPKDFLCLYVFAGVSVAAQENLAFFLNFGFDADSADIDYVFIMIDVQERVLPLAPELTALIDAAASASNVHLFTRRNRGLDFCSYAEALALLGGVDAVVAKYKYFVFVNDTVRGPFLPSYLFRHRHRRQSTPTRRSKQRAAAVVFAGRSSRETVDGSDGALSWYRLFTSPLSRVGSDVKLIGAYLSSQRTSHVQSMMFATDASGLVIVRDVFRCFLHKSDTIAYSEVGLSRKVLAAGYNIASTIAAYDGIDFRRVGVAPNRRQNPTLEFYGTALLPYELMFVKCAGDQIRARQKYGLAAPFFPQVEALTDWYYGAVARSLLCDRRSSGSSGGSSRDNVQKCRSRVAAPEAGVVTVNGTTGVLVLPPLYAPTAVAIAAWDDLPVVSRINGSFVAYLESLLPPAEAPTHVRK